jgi:phosphate acyltransferase
VTSRPIIALDAMGGDGGPAVTIAAAELALSRQPGTLFRLYGREDAIRAELAKAPNVARDAVVVHTDGEILATDKPSQVLRRARHSSIGLAVDAVKAGEAHVAVSAGNTGALMAIAKLGLKTMPGIDRPALAALLPTVANDVVMLDLGANTECDSENLVQFAVMGAAFARTVLGLARPRVALLNIGEEDLKGTDELKHAAALLRAADLPMQFAGFTEGDKIGQGEVDVVVSDGFSGNVALKTAEGTARLVVQLLTRAFKSSVFTMAGFMMSRGALRALRTHLDPNNHNGAVFLGLNGLVVKSHGGANVQGFANAIRVAHDLVVDDIARRILDDLENFQAHRADMPDVVATRAAQ